MADVQKYLRQVELYDVRINNKLEELRRLKLLTTQITATLKPDVVSHSGNQDKMGAAVAKIVDLENEINDAVDAYVDKRREVAALVDKMENPEESAVLHKLYFEYKTWKDIAKEMHMTERNAQYIHGRALLSFGRILRGETK